LPSEWINSYHQTNETEILDNDGVKIHDYISCEQGAGVEVDKNTHPELWEKLGGGGYKEEGILTASDAQAEDRFFVVSSYEGRLVVGAYGQSTAAIDAGKVYIYDWNGSSYTEVGQLTASDASDGDFFGTSVSVYEDRLVVGASHESTAGYRKGKVYIYDWNGSQYIEVGTLTASDAINDDRFGKAVSVYENRLVVGAYFRDTPDQNAGKVYIYDWNGSSYTEVSQLTASDGESFDYFGSSVSVYEDRLSVGAPTNDTVGSNAGKVYIYDWNGSQYVEVGTLTASDAINDDRFGSAVSVYENRLVVGAPRQGTAGKVYIYDWEVSQYIEVSQLIGSDVEEDDRFGTSVHINIYRLVVGVYETENVYYYDDASVVFVPDMPRVTGSPAPWQVIADAT